MITSVVSERGGYDMSEGYAEGPEPVTEVFTRPVMDAPADDEGLERARERARRLDPRQTRRAAEEGYMDAALPEAGDFFAPAAPAVTMDVSPASGAPVWGTNVAVVRMAERLMQTGAEVLSGPLTVRKVIIRDPEDWSRVERLARALRQTETPFAMAVDWMGEEYVAVVTWGDYWGSSMEAIRRDVIGE